MIARSKTKAKKAAPKLSSKANATGAGGISSRKAVNKKSAPKSKLTRKTVSTRLSASRATNSKKAAPLGKAKRSLPKKTILKGGAAKTKATSGAKPIVKKSVAKNVVPKKLATKAVAGKANVLKAAPGKGTKVRLDAKSAKGPAVLSKPPSNLMIHQRSTEVQPKVATKLAQPIKTSAKTATLVPSAKLLKPAKPVIPPRPIVTGPPTNPKIVQKIRGLQENREQKKDLAQPPTSRPVLIPHSRAPEQPRDPGKDRLILMVRDPFWLHACWDITRKSVERAKAALGGHWHTARPMLRLLKTEDNSTTSNTENVYRDIEIHGGVRHWYIETETPASTFRLLLGYLFGNNRFHELARSNPVTTPVPGSPDSTDDHWADLSKDAERIYALSGGHEDDTAAGELQQMMQEKLKRPIGNPSMTQFGSGAEGSLRRMKNFHLELDAEMVVFGTTHPHALLTVAGEPVPIRSDGTFSARVPLPNNRQVLAATSKSRDGLDEQTIVLAVERNTKVMEPLSSADPDE